MWINQSQKNTQKTRQCGNRKSKKKKISSAFSTFNHLDGVGGVKNPPPCALARFGANPRAFCKFCGEKRILLKQMTTKKHYQIRNMDMYSQDIHKTNRKTPVHMWINSKQQRPKKWLKLSETKVDLEKHVWMSESGIRKKSGKSWKFEMIICINFWFF